jgi:hypothetical protein
MEQNFEDECSHETVAERALTGTCVIDEVRLAVQNVTPSSKFLKYE